MRLWLVIVVLGLQLPSLAAGPHVASDQAGGDSRPSVPARNVIERKQQDGILLELDQLSTRTNFFEGICNESGESNIVGIKVNTPFTSLKASADSLLADLKKAGIVTAEARVFKASRIYLAPEYRPDDGSYNGSGPETLCLKLKGLQTGAEVCKALKKSIGDFEFGYKYSGCLSSAGREFLYGIDKLTELEQKKRPHNKESDFAAAIIGFKKGKFDEAKKAVESLGYSIPHRISYSGSFFEVPTGTDTRAAFDELKRKLLELPSSPITSVDPNTKLSLNRSLN